MKRTTLLFGLAILAEAGIAALAPASISIPIRATAYLALGLLASRSDMPWPPFQSALALGAFGTALLASLRVLGTASTDPYEIVAIWTAVVIGAALGHYLPRILPEFRGRYRGHRGAERVPGDGLTVHIGGQAFSVRDWSVFGLFIDAPRGRFAPKQEVMIEIGGGQAPLSAEVVRLTPSGVGLRFTALADADRVQLRRKLIRHSLAV